jgi:hypothetical protein
MTSTSPAVTWLNRFVGRVNHCELLAVNCTTGSPFKALDRRSGWYEELDWVALLPCPLWSCQVLMFPFPFFVTPASALSHIAAPDGGPEMTVRFRVMEPVPEEFVALIVTG